MKYNDSSKYGWLKAFKEYRVDNPQSTQDDYKKVVRLKEAKIKGKIHIPPLTVDNLEGIEFNAHHTNEESRHNVTKEEALSFIKEAKVTIVRWNGASINFYSEKGATYLLNGEIRTAFHNSQFDDVAKLIIEEVQK